MTKEQIINKLMGMGEFHYDMMSYTKKQLEDYYEGIKQARSMTLEELEERLRSKGLF